MHILKFFTSFIDTFTSSRIQAEETTMKTKGLYSWYMSTTSTNDFQCHMALGVKETSSLERIEYSR